MDNKWIISIQSWWSNLDYIIKQNMLHPWKLTWNLTKLFTQLKRKVIFKTSIFRFHVNLPGCTSSIQDLSLIHQPWAQVPPMWCSRSEGCDAPRCFRSPVLLKLVRYIEHIYCSTMLHPRKIHMEPTKSVVWVDVSPFPRGLFLKPHTEMEDTVDGNNPKQPPGMYKSL